MVAINWLSIDQESSESSKNISTCLSRCCDNGRLIISCLGCRCPVHALGLAVLAMLGSEPVNALVCNAHMMASRFHASSAASAFLADEAKEMGVNTELLPCNLSQVQSVYECLQSLVQMESAIKRMLQNHPDFPMNQAVCIFHALTYVPFGHQ